MLDTLIFYLHSIICLKWREKSGRFKWVSTGLFTHQSSTEHNPEKCQQQLSALISPKKKKQVEIFEGCDEVTRWSWTTYSWPPRQCHRRHPSRPQLQWSPQGAQTKLFEPEFELHSDLTLSVKYLSSESRLHDLITRINKSKLQFSSARKLENFLFLFMGFVFQVEFARQRRIDERRLLLVVELGPARARLVLHTDHLMR